MYVDIAARIEELGRQRERRGGFSTIPRPDSVCYDAYAARRRISQQVLNDKLYEIYFRFLET